MAAAPVLIPDYIFMWSFLFSFIGAIFFSLTQLVSVDPSSILVNKNVSLIVNIVVGVSGIVSMFVWFNMDIPQLDKTILNAKVVKNNINN
jgi:ABC-type amino acid transport system permease subunit